MAIDPLEFSLNCTFNIFLIMKSSLITLILFFLSFGGIHAQEEAKLLGRWSDPTLAEAFFGRYNEVWGYAQDGKEYAIIGSTFGTHFIDVTDPNNPQELIRVGGKAQGTGLIHRDFHNMGTYLYAVADEGASSLQVMDMSGLPDTVIVVYDSSEYIQRSHNIFIDTSSALLYAVSVRSSVGGGLVVLDISIPQEPKLVNSLNMIDGVSVNPHDVFVQRDTVFINNARAGLVIADFVDPQNPKLISSYEEYQEMGYNHSGWATPDMDIYYMADETFATRIKVLDLKDISEPEVISVLNIRDTINDGLPHNPLWFCNRLYVASYYDMLQVYDVSDPANPERILYYDDDPSPNDGKFRGAWGVYPYLPSGSILLSSLDSGLYVFEGLDGSDCFDDISSIADLRDAAKFSMVPTVSTGNFSIRSDWTQEYRWSVFDFKGRYLHRGQQSTSSMLDLSYLPNGIYVLHLQAPSGESLGSVRCIIQH